MAAEVTGDDLHRTLELLQIARDVVCMSINGGIFKKDCTDLVRRIALLSHLFEEMRDFKETKLGVLGVSRLSSSSSSSSSSSCSRESWEFDMVVALRAAKRLLFVANNFNSNNAPPVSCNSLIFFLLFLLTKSSIVFIIVVFENPFDVVLDPCWSFESNKLFWGMWVLL